MSIVLPQDIGFRANVRKEAQRARQAIKIDILNRVCRALHTNGIENWLMCGALLGYYRDNSLMLHDPDLDIGVMQGALDRISDDTLALHGLFAYRKFDYLWRVCLAGDNVKYANPVHADLFPHYNNGKGKMIFDSPDLHYEYTEFHPIPARIHGIACYIPSNPLRQVEEHYGTWQIVKKSWHWAKDPVNTSTTPADYWDNFYAQGKQREPSLFAQWCMDQAHFKGDILELAPGCGRDMRFFKSKHTVTGIEQSIEAAHRLNAEGLNCVNADMSHMLHTGIGPFDCVYTRFSLHSLTNLNETRTLTGVKELLRKGGRIYIETRSQNDPLFGKGIPLPDNAYYSDHYRRFTTEVELKHKLETLGFKVEYIQSSKAFAPGPEGSPAVIRAVASI